MKYIEYPELTHLSRALTHDSMECTVHTRIEAYTTKSITKEKRLWREMEHTYAEELAHFSPPESMHMENPFGPLDKSARRTQWLLIATLNAAFPDHDFSDLRPDHFCKERDGAGVLNALSTTLISLRDRPGNSIGGPASAQPRSFSSYPPTSSDFFPSSEPTSSSPTRSFVMNPLPQIQAGTHPTLYRMLDDIISLADCEVFSYVPDLEADPHRADSDDEWSSDDDHTSQVVDTEDTFEFDDEYDSSPERSPVRRFSQSESLGDTEYSPPPTPFIGRRKCGALLWSSHWFFHNKKQKRILFISVWARKKNVPSPISRWTSTGDLERERFFGWEGSAGAGARAYQTSAGAK